MSHKVQKNMRKYFIHKVLTINMTGCIVMA